MPSVTAGEKAQNQGDDSKRLGGVLAAASGRWGEGG